MPFHLWNKRYNSTCKRVLHGKMPCKFLLMTKRRSYHDEFEAGWDKYFFLYIRGRDWILAFQNKYIFLKAADYFERKKMLTSTKMASSKNWNILLVYTTPS